MKTIYGVVHVPAFPGDPHGTTFDEALSHAMRDAEALASGGVHGLVIENFGSIPFPKGDANHRIPPHQVAALTRIATKCKQSFDLSVGINCLRNDAYSAMGIAAACDLDFIRVNVHVGAAVTDQGIIEGEAYQTLRYRRELGCRAKIFADVLVKHAAPLGVSDPYEVTRDCVHRGLADAVIVSGSGTGVPVDVERLDMVATAAQSVPVFVGSGLTPESFDDIFPRASGAIVGTWFKRAGITRNPVDASRVRDFMDQVAAWSPH
ncbi:MAG: BtpA/SgcQ family protein [bacterium]